MTIHEFLHAPEALGRPALIDGAMGTQLSARGVEAGGVSCLAHPDAVLAVHRAYVDAGADALITNTLTMNRVYLESHGIDLDLVEVNRAGARLARGAAGDRVGLGDLSSTGQMLEPLGTYTEAQFEAAFREQAVLLADAGVDALIIETMTDLRETRCALRGCLSTGLPTIASISLMNLHDGGRTMMGDRATECAATLESDGAAAFGLNCGDLDPVELAEAASRVREHTKLPLVTQPNAGKPRLVRGEAVFDLGPEDFADGVLRCAVAGASVVGGCCGTSPDHIRAVRNALDQDA